MKKIRTSKVDVNIVISINKSIFNSNLINKVKLKLRIPQSKIENLGYKNL